MLKFVDSSNSINDSITVQVGRCEKQISGLTKKTTCLEVVRALIKEHRLAATSAENEDFLFPSDKTTRELSYSYEIVETWRGNKNVLPPKTQILKAWHSWEIEQKHVKFELRRSSSRVRGRGSLHKRRSKKQDCRHKLSHGQKRRIRRSMKMYQKAVLKQKSNIGEDKNEDQLDYILSEEQFVDGELTSPDCIPYKVKFARSALDDSDLVSEHYAYHKSRLHHRRRVSAHKQRNKEDVTGCSQRKQRLYKRHTTAQAAGTDSNDGDADDEKSILMTSSASAAASDYMSGATTTESSCGTTTCSEISGTSSSVSGTSSSETSSSSNDFFNTEQFLAKRAATEAEAAMKNAKSIKSNGATKLFKKVTSQTLLGSFRKKKRNVNNANVVSMTTTHCHKLAATTKVKNEVIKKVLHHHQDLTGPDHVTSPPLMHTSINSEKEAVVEADEDKTIKKLKDDILRGNQVLFEHSLKEKQIDSEIERLTTELQRLTDQSGNTFLQDTMKLKKEVQELNENQESEEGSWIKNCNDQSQLSSYIEWSQKIIEKQLKIEECKRKEDILLHEKAHEEWKATKEINNKLAVEGSFTCSLNSSESSEEGESIDEEKKLKVSSFVNKSSNHSTDELCLSRIKKEEILDEMGLNWNKKSTSGTEVQHRSKEMKTLIELRETVEKVRELASSSVGVPPDVWRQYGDLVVYFDQQMLSNPSQVPSLLSHQQNCEDFSRKAPKVFDKLEDCSETSLSRLPSNFITSSKPQLLPMHPISICPDSDYEELEHVVDPAVSSEVDCSESISSAITSSGISTSDSANKLMTSHNYKFLQDLPMQSSNASNSTDDSGNASAGSISSFTSADGCGVETASRSGSYDGESPTPNRGLNVQRQNGGWRGKFLFSAHQKRPFNEEEKIKPINQNISVTSSHQRRADDVIGSFYPMKCNVIPLKYEEIRRSVATNRNFINHRSKSLTKIRSKSHHIPIYNNPNMYHPFQDLRLIKMNERRHMISDNDSDTGLSSLHSTDSLDPFIYSETLV